jgi:hypothetical protein
MNSKLAGELLELSVRDVIGGALMFCGLEVVGEWGIFMMFIEIGTRDQRWQWRVGADEIRALLANLEAWGFIRDREVRVNWDGYRLDASLLAGWRRQLEEEGVLPKFEPALKAAAELLKQSLTRI